MFVPKAILSLIFSFSQLGPYQCVCKSWRDAHQFRFAFHSEYHLDQDWTTLLLHKHELLLINPSFDNKIPSCVWSYNIATKTGEQTDRLHLNHFVAYNTGIEWENVSFINEQNELCCFIEEDEYTLKNTIYSFESHYGIMEFEEELVFSDQYKLTFVDGFRNRNHAVFYTEINTGGLQLHYTRLQKDSVPLMNTSFIQKVQVCKKWLLNDYVAICWHSNQRLEVYVIGFWQSPYQVIKCERVKKCQWFLSNQYLIRFEKGKSTCCIWKFTN